MSGPEQSETSYKDFAPFEFERNAFLQCKQYGMRFGEGGSGYSRYTSKKKTRAHYTHTNKHTVKRARVI